MLSHVVLWPPPKAGALLTGAGALAISHSSNAMAKQTAQSGYLDALIASAAKVTFS